MNPAVSPKLEPNPQLVWDTINAYQRTSALRAAIELDLFSAIGADGATAENLAKRSNASTRGIRILCDYLTVLGFLSKEGGAYALTPTSSAFLDRRSPACMASMVQFMNSPKLMSGFVNLTETVRRGGTLLAHDGVNEAELDEWVIFAKSMMPLMKPPSELIAEEAIRAGRPPRRVLDIAAGHGLFGIAVAQRAPEAEIVAQDWPAVLKIAEANAQSAGVGNRYSALAGNAFQVAFGSGFDLVLLTNFLHHFDEQACVALLKKIYACLTPAGRLLTLEFVPNEDRVTPPIPATFSMMMLGLTPAGDAYTKSDFERMMAAAGFTQNELKQVPQSPQQLIISTK
jgi:ubiquinone/menaquinone biosynthesis C-methylase UbiE